jgi:hypothetical protein
MFFDNSGIKPSLIAERGPELQNCMRVLVFMKRDVFSSNFYGYFVSKIVVISRFCLILNINLNNRAWI